jgi:hypothetical protein
MGQNEIQGQQHADRLQWVATPIGEHRWTGGPLFCRQRGAGWVVELSRHGERGRLCVPLAGPFEALGDAKEAAADLVYAVKARRHRRTVAEGQVAA